jgi:hypothetical protein
VNPHLPAMIGTHRCGPDEPLLVIAGPCVIESLERCLQIADHLVELSQRLPIQVVFKASYDKANRTSVGSFRGPGIDEGLAVLDEANAAGALPNEDLRLLSEFLAEPSRSTFLALASVVPQSSRTFKPPRGLAPSSSRSDRHHNSHIDPDAMPTPAEMKDFIHRHLDRCAAVMLLLGTLSAAPELWAERSNITPSRQQRYNKWFEGLPRAYRRAIIRVGKAAGESNRGGSCVLAVVGDFLAGPESLNVIEQALGEATV